MVAKYCITCIAILIMMTFIPGQNTPGVNLFNNPGFESGTDWWGFADSLGDSGSATIDFSSSEAAHSGNNGAKIIVSERSVENWHIQLQTPPNWTAAIGYTYKLTFWARVDSSSKSVHVAIHDGPPDYEYQGGTDFYLDTAWQQFETQRMSDVEGEGAMRFNIYVGSYTGVYYFDDFEVIEMEQVSIKPIQLPNNEKYFSNTLSSRDIIGRSTHARPLMKGVRINWPVSP